MLPRILLVGDSITQECFDSSGGWGASVACWYQRRADVFNRGFDGWNTRWILKNKDRIRASLGDTPPGTYLWGTLLLGANDNSTSFQHVPLEEYESNIRALVLWMRDEVGVPRILVLGPPPYHAPTHTTFRNIPLQQAPRSDERHAAYGECARRVAESVGMPYVSLRDAVRDKLGERWPEALKDGLHFSAIGQAIAFDNIRDAVELHFPEVVPRGPMLLPDFEEMKQWPDGCVPVEVLERCL